MSVYVPGPAVASVAITKTDNWPGNQDAFFIETTFVDGRKEEVWRPWSEVETLSSRLSKIAAAAAMPASLKDLAAGAAGGTSLVDARRAGLQAYLESLLVIEPVATSETFNNFLLGVFRWDWPESGPIDLSVQDLPHETSCTEWWYYNMHFSGEDGGRYSAYFVIFRRIAGVDKETGVKEYHYASHFAIVDVENQRYEGDSLIERRSATFFKEMIRSFRDLDGILKDAFCDVLDKGVIPLPDRMPKDEPVCDMTKLDIKIGDSTLRRNADGSYTIFAVDGKNENMLNVTISPKKSPVRHGTNGIVKGHQGDDMFYYCVTRCGIEGSFKIRGRDVVIKGGQAWYDHEFGGVPVGDLSEALRYGWNWASIQLENGWEFSAYFIYDRYDVDKVIDRPCMVVAPDGTWTQVHDVTFEPVEGCPTWQSTRTFAEYPLVYRLDSESLDLHLTLTAVFGEQELMTLITMVAYWEGRAHVTGTYRGEAVTGLSFIERNGFSRVTRLNDFFRAVGKRVRNAVRDKYPDTLDRAKAARLFVTPDTDYLLDGVNLEVAQRQIVAPIRSITDRGGKSWRSYATLACVDVVGGDSREILDYLSAAEFLHVGSLVIDDIQDESNTRRGGPSCHLQYGVSTAINAGTSAYFSIYYAIAGLNVSAEVRNQVYKEFFLTMRAGHLGQALDINGLDYVMDECIETGNGDLARSRVLATHRLKTAAPAGSLARTGVYVGAGTEEQAEAVGHYFESVGTAFQIMDDVLNLRGLITSSADKKAGVVLKDLGEDITAGKVTYPIAMAIGRIPKDEMKHLWTVVKSKPSDQAVIDECIATLEKYGAIQACVDESIAIVEAAWKRLDPIVPDSFYKIMLRAFGWFVVERKI